MPATDIEKLVVQLGADIRGYERALAKAQGVTLQRTKAMQSQFLKMNKGISADFMSLGKGFAAGLAVIGSLDAFKSLADGATRTQNALKVAGLSGEELTRVYDQLFASAQRNSVPVETLAQLYGRLSMVQSELNAGQSDIVNFADKVALALRVAGTDAQTASGALTQLSQALGAGTVRSEEFSSVLEGAPTIAQAAARGIIEAGGSVAKLKQLVIDGKVSSQAFFRGFLAGSTQLETQAAAAVSTVDQAFVRLQNSLQDAAGKLNEVTGISQTAVTYIGNLATYVTDLSKAFATLANGPIGDAIGKLQQINALVAQLIPAMNSLRNLPANLQNVTDFVNKEVSTYQGDEAKSREQLQSELKAIQNALTNGTAPNRLAYQESAKAIADKLYPNGGRDVPPLTMGIPTGTQTTVAASPTLNATASPISLKDYAVKAEPKTASGSSTEKLDDYAKALEATNKQTAAITAETLATARINPLIEDYGYSIEKAKKAHELLTEAQEAGKAVTPQLTAEINASAEAYAKATADAARLAAEQQKLTEAVDFYKSTAGSSLTTFRQTWIETGSAIEGAKSALNSFFDTMMQRLEQMAADKLITSLVGGLLGGGVPALTGGIGSVLGSGNGYFPPAPTAAAMAKVPRLPSPSRLSAAPIDVRVGVDDEGALQAYVRKEGRRTEARVAVAGEARLKNFRKRELHDEVSKHMKDPRGRG